MDEKKYEIALSFAGEDREYVEQVAKTLRDSGVRVFYDAYEEANLWGKDLYVHLRDVYKNQALYTILFLSEHYAKKLWTHHERASAQARAFEESREYILPARFDNTDVPGILSTTGYIDLRRKNPHEFVALVLERLSVEGWQPPHDEQFLDFSEDNLDWDDGPPFTGIDAKKYALIDGLPNGLSKFVCVYSMTTVDTLLDVLYMKFLRDVVPPGTYGSSWIIKCVPGNRLIVPKDYPKYIGKPIRNVEPDWLNWSLGDVGIAPGRRYSVVAVKQNAYVGIVSNRVDPAEVLDSVGDGFGNKKGNMIRMYEYTQREGKWVDVTKIDMGWHKYVRLVDYHHRNGLVLVDQDDWVDKWFGWKE